MRRPPPRPLWEEEETLTQALIKEFLSPLSEEEMDCEMNEEEDQAFHEAMERWMNERASEELKLFWEYGKWIGDEGQLCDGKGNYLLTDHTQKVILNTDGTLIKNPVLDKRVSDLYEKF